MSNKGLFVVLEGLDRCGKTTQTKLVAQGLKEIYGEKVITMRFPDRTTEIGELLDKYFRKEIEFNHQVVQLLCIANRWEKKEEIEQLIDEGYVIVCDRYIYSGIAYGMANGLGQNWVEVPNDGLPEPDLILYLDISVDKIKDRSGYGEEIYEKEEFQLKVKQAYEFMFDKYDFTKIDADTTKKELKEEIIEVIQSCYDQ